MEINMQDLERLCEQMSTKIKPCPKCGKPRKVAAIFKDDNNDEVIGWIQFCIDCDNDTDIEVLDIKELDWV